MSSAERASEGVQSKEISNFYTRFQGGENVSKTFKIGTKDCTTRTVKCGGKYHCELIVDGKVFDGTAEGHKKDVEASMKELIKKYQEALKADNEFGLWVRGVFREPGD